MRPNLTTQKETAQAARLQDRLETDPRVYASLDRLVRLQHQATGYSFLPRQPVHSLLSGRYASRLRGRGLNFEELRHYQQGDDIRTMDWKATARTRRPHVRVYTEERDRAVLLLVDQRQHMFFGSSERMKSVVAAEAAALAAWRALAVGDRVGAVLFNDRTMTAIRPRRSKATVMQVLRTIETLNHELRADAPFADGAPQLNAALHGVLRLAGHDSLVILISDGQGADEETTRLTAQLAEHNDILGIHLYDPLRASPRPGAGGGAITDGRLQVAVDFDDNRLWDRISRDYRQEIDDLRTIFRKMSAPLLPINTADPVIDQIRRWIGRAPRGASGGRKR